MNIERLEVPQFLCIGQTLGETNGEETTREIMNFDIGRLLADGKWKVAHRVTRVE